MAHYLNLFAGALLFIVSSALTYGLWDPVMDFLSYFPAPLYVFCGVAWVLVLFTAVFFLPTIHLISEDKTQ